MILVLRHWFSRLEITKLSEWKIHVLNSAVPVIVQFHAQWSEASLFQHKQFIPLSSSPSWNIAEVDIDLLPSLVEALDIKKIPTLYIVNKGKTLEKIEGEIPSKRLESLTYRIRLLSGEWTEEDLATHLINSAYDLLQLKKYDESIEKYSEALQLESCLDKFELTCWVGLSKAHFMREDCESAEFFADKTRKKYATTLAHHPELHHDLNNIMKNIGDKRDVNVYKEYNDVISGINQQIFESPFDNKIHAKLAAAHHHYGFIEEAISKAIQIVETEGTLTGNGYKVLMEILQDLGPENQYVKDAQPKLQRINARYRSR